MPGKDLRYTMSLNDRLSPAVKSAAQNTKKADSDISRSTKKSTQSMNGLSKSAGLVKGAFIAVAAVATSKLVGAFIRAGSQIETLNMQFETLLKSESAAKERMEILTNFAAKTPFQLPGIAKASRTLETLTHGALSTGDGLRLVGDAAAVTGYDFENLAMWVGRAYSGLQSNRPVGEAMMRMQEVGLITGEARNEIEKLTATGMGKKAWKVLEQELKRTEGGMKKLSKTVPGLASTIKDQLNLAMVKITSSGIWDQLRKGLEGVTSVFDKALSNGTFEKIGMVLFNVSQVIKSTVATAFNFLGTIVANVTSLILSGLSKITGAVTWLGEKLPARIRPFWVKNLGELSDTFASNAAIMDTVASQFADKTVANFDGVKTSFVSLKNTIVSSGADIKKQLEGEDGGAAPAKSKREQAIAITADPDAVKEIHQEFTKIGKSARDQELMDLKFWYDEQYELLKGNKEAQGELDRLFLDKRLQVYKDYAAEERKLDQDMIKERAKSYMSLGVAIGRALNTGFQGQKGGIKEAFRGVLDVTVGYLEKQLLAAIVGNQLKNFATLGPVGLLKAAGETALISGIFAAARSGIQTFQTGGMVQQQPGIPATGDRTPIFANPGEIILNRSQQRNLSRQMGGNYNVLIGGTTINVSGNASTDTVAEIDRTLQDRNEELREQLLTLSDSGRISGVTF